MKQTPRPKLNLKPHHIAWLACHPERSAEWLAERLRDNFHVHHVDGDHSNDSPRNLVLIEGLDHMLLFHGMKNYSPNKIAGRRGGLARWAKVPPGERSKIQRKAALKRWKRARAAKRQGEAHKRANANGAP